LVGGSVVGVGVGAAWGVEARQWGDGKSGVEIRQMKDNFGVMLPCRCSLTFLLNAAEEVQREVGAQTGTCSSARCSLAAYSLTACVASVLQVLLLNAAEEVQREIGAQTGAAYQREVLLMNAAEEVINELGMKTGADYKKEFFKLRQQEFQPLKKANFGGLASLGQSFTVNDVPYFNFQSYIQWKLIARLFPTQRVRQEISARLGRKLLDRVAPEAVTIALALPPSSLSSSSSSSASPSPSSSTFSPLSPATSLPFARIATSAPPASSSAEQVDDQDWLDPPSLLSKQSLPPPPPAAAAGGGEVLPAGLVAGVEEILQRLLDVGFLQVGGWLKHSQMSGVVGCRWSFGVVRVNRGTGGKGRCGQQGGLVAGVEEILQRLLDVGFLRAYTVDWVAAAGGGGAEWDKDRRGSMQVKVQGPANLDGAVLLLAESNYAQRYSSSIIRAFFERMGVQADVDEYFYREKLNYKPKSLLEQAVLSLGDPLVPVVNQFDYAGRANPRFPLVEEHPLEEHPHPPPPFLPLPFSLPPSPPSPLPPPPSITPPFSTPSFRTMWFAERPFCASLRTHLPLLRDEMHSSIVRRESATRRARVIDRSEWVTPFTAFRSPHINRRPIATPYGQRLSGLCGLAALVAGVVAISFLATHASADDVHLCENVDCGKIARCSANPDGKTTQCMCDDGYFFQDSDKTCVIDGCAFKDCGVRAKCTLLKNGSAECQCGPGGYFRESDQECIADVCNNSPCGASAKCVRTGDFKHQCQCNDGLVFQEADKTCIPAECANKECGESAKCVVTAPGSAQCKCLEEGLSFQEADKTCIRDLCANVDCGKIAKCFVNGDGKSTQCVCEDGYLFEEVNKACIVDVCAFKDCGRRAKCYVASSGSAECDCGPGSYFRESDTECIADVCNNSPCGASAKCVRTGDFKHQCQCNDGLVFQEADKTCIPAECANKECGESAKCVVTAPGSAQCECLEEGLSFQEADKTCIRVPPAVTCDKDCGSAECVLKDRTAQCKCPGSLVFDEANKACSEKAPAPAKDPCKARTVKCGKNFKCVVKNGQKAACECETGYTKRNNQCIGEP
ncbi:unnamed protein product, partial [Closterium sp. NIES-64]